MADWLLEHMVRYPRTSLLIGFVMVVVFSGFIWWNVIWQSPQRVFEGMLANNLTTASVTKLATANGSNQSLKQYARLELGSTNAADWLVTVQQRTSTVTTESIGTPTAGYIRYTTIATRQKLGSEAYSFNAVLNRWGKADGKTDASLNQLFSQTVIDVSNAPLPPIGHLPDAEQRTLLAYMRSQAIFSPTYATVKRMTVDSRSVYSYQVAVRLGPYIRLMQAFSHDLGLRTLDSIDPSQYSTLPPITLTMAVDRGSHQLVAVSYPTTGFVQHYNAWGLRVPIHLPKQTISTTELQTRLQSVGT